VLVERVTGEREALCQVRVSKPLQAGRGLRIAGVDIAVVGREGEFYRLRFPENVLGFLDRHGEVPLPPYIQRPVAEPDAERYQTVYGHRPGSVAAPTAGLHFSEAVLDGVRARGVATAQVTLHVGAGTFQPVRVDDVSRHRMHSERYSVSAETVAAVEQCRRAGGRVVAVGTTVVRALESVALDGELRAGSGETELFITPGFEFRVVDALLTNFHLPASTLLMLVCAFGGRERVLAAYRAAVAEGYRFFSYGDAMFLDRARRGG
jgi:S-adenosylmethionine:tRNA ribosyltransferase-isomerase